jgi:alcohol dehydrogenase class IV
MEAREKMQMAAYIAGIGFGNISGGIEHSLGHSFGALFHVHHGVCVGLFLSASIAFQAKVTNRFYDLAKKFGVKTKNRERDAILKDLLMGLRNFMHEVNCPLSINELDKPKISNEDYLAQLDQMVEFAFNDYCTLSSTRRINRSQYRKILEIVYENKIEDLMDLFYN